jgi:hypothetical protein
MQKSDKRFPTFPTVSNEGPETQCLYSFEAVRWGFPTRFNLETDFDAFKRLILNGFRFPAFPPFRGSCWNTPKGTPYWLGAYRKQRDRADSTTVHPVRHEVEIQNSVTTVSQYAMN